MTAAGSAQRVYESLRDAGDLAGARKALARALPPRRAAWWALLCLHHSSTRKPLATEAEREALEAARAWVLAPTESARRAARAAGRRAGATSAAGILAQAVFHSGGSLSKPGLPAVPAPEGVCGRLCGAVVYLAAVRREPARYKEHLREYLLIGEQVARGELPLPAAPPPAEEPAAPAEPFPGLAEALAAFLAKGAAS